MGYYKNLEIEKESEYVPEKPTGWDKMERVTNLAPSRMESWQQLQTAMEQRGTPITKAQAKKTMRQNSVRQKIAEHWMNDIYLCTVDRFKTDAVDEWGNNPPLQARLAITRHDKAAVHDWRHFQKIKNDIFGENCEAVELYPDESRLMDTANTYWLYVFKSDYRLPFGQQYRQVEDADSAGTMGAVQRPFDEERTDYHTLERLLRAQASDLKIGGI